MDLRHEFMHIIDELIPNISPLNPETREAASFFYVSGPEDAEAYTTNPLEAHANHKRKEYKIAIEEMLNAQTVATQGNAHTL